MPKEFKPSSESTSWFPTLVNIIGGILTGKAERHDCRAYVSGKLCEVSVYGMGRSQAERFVRVDVKISKSERKD